MRNALNNPISTENLRQKMATLSDEEQQLIQRDREENPGAQ